MLISGYIKHLIKHIKESEFARQVGTLATGSLVAQGIGLAAAPILTRLYDPASFAVLALFMALVATIAPAACGRYDIAVVVAKDDQDCNGLLALAIWLAGACSFLIFLVFVAGQQPLQTFLNAKALGEWWLVVPLTLFLTAVGTALNCYSNRLKRYAFTSRVLFAQAAVSPALSVGLGMAGYLEDGLLIAAVLNSAFGAIVLAHNYRKVIGKIPWQLNRIAWDLARRYKSFPLYEASTTIFNSLQQVLPIFFLAKYFPVEIVGYYSLLTRIAWTPLALVAQSVSQVLLRKVAELVQRGDDATQYIHHLSLVLLGIAVIPAIILFWYAESLFGLVFGENWREAGRLLSILGLGFPVRFVASTVSVAIISSGNSKLGAYWKIGAFATTFAMFWAFGDKMTIDDLVVVMMVVDLAIYATYYFVALYSVRHPRSFK